MSKQKSDTPEDSRSFLLHHLTPMLRDKTVLEISAETDTEDHVTEKPYDVIVLIGALDRLTQALRFAHATTRFVIADAHDDSEKLSELLSSLGLIHTHYYYPFPDYKDPIAILSSAKKTFDTPIFHFLLGNNAHIYRQDSANFTDIFTHMAEQEKSNKLHTCTNSFLVVASATELDMDDDWLVRRYTPQRAKRYQNEIIVTRQGVVEKRSLVDNRLITAVPIYSGLPLSLQFHTLSRTHEFLSLWIELFRQFADLARASIEEDNVQENESLIELHVNNVMGDEGKLQWFDRETPCPPSAIIDLTHVLINSAYTLFEQSEHIRRYYEGQLMKDALRDFIVRSSGIRLDNTDFRRFVEIQSHYLSQLNSVTVQSVKSAYEHSILKTRM